MNQSVRTSTQLKCMIPGYRRRWIKKASTFLDQVSHNLSGLRITYDGDNPIATGENNNFKLKGLVSTPDDQEMYHLLKPQLPQSIGMREFRLARDIVTRYFYPHLRPDLAPDTQSNSLAGFHGQHKDTILHMVDNAQRERFLQAFAPKGDDVIIDCGSFLGFGEVALASEFKQIKIFALEADRRNFEILDSNIGLNNLSNVTGLHAAIWSEHQLDMNLATGHAQANTLITDVYDGGNRAVVPTMTIDGLVHDFGIDRVSMISLTVNGAEIEALNGAKAVLEKHRPRLRIAGWYERNGVAVAESCRQILEAAGYDVYVGPRLGVLALPSEGVCNR